MNWQEVVNGNQQQAKTNMNNQLGGAIPYMPLIFNQQNPAGAALSLALGNLINDAIGRRNDAHNVSRFANAKDGVDKQFAINTAPTQQTGTGLLGSATQGEEQAELTEEQQAAQAEANRNAMLNNVRAIRSSGDYYNALVDAAVRNGASRAKAMDWAAKEAGMYQDRANKAYQDVLNQYGYNGEGALNGIGMEMASLMANEGRGDFAKNIMQGNLSPKDMRMLAEKEAAEDRAFARQLELAEHNASLRAAYGGGSQRGGGSSRDGQEKVITPMDLIGLEMKLIDNENKLRDAGVSDEEINKQLGDAKRYLYNIKNGAEDNADIERLLSDPSNEGNAWSVIQDAVRNPHYGYGEIASVINNVSRITGIDKQYFFDNMEYSINGLDKNKLGYTLGIDAAKSSGGSASGNGNEPAVNPQYTKSDWLSVVNNAGGNGLLDQLIEYNKNIGKE